MNRQALQAAAALPGAPHWLRQVHGSEVVRFEGGPAGADQDRTEADAAVTDQPGTVLAILTADCLPVLFSAVDGSEIAAAHAGWRGLCDGVLEATVCAMHTPAHRLQAWLGPAAGPLAYEVGAEVRQAFIARSFDAATAFAPTRPGHFLCDLYTLARQRLEAIGLEAVSGGGYCTISDEARFFSHRRDQRSGRMASLIWIRPSA